MSGRFKEDVEGFAKAVLELNERATFDETKKMSPLWASRDNSEVLEEIIEEREMIAKELNQQMAAKIKEHFFLKERKPSDFVRPKRSEVLLFGKQVQGQETRIRELEGKLEEKEEEKMDKEAYKRIKDEIKRRKEAKERLLQQGFPELKPYVSV